MHALEGAGGGILPRANVVFYVVRRTSPQCRPDTVRWFRLYNNAMGGQPNHLLNRTSWPVIDAMQTQGWLARGPGFSSSALLHLPPLLWGVTRLWGGGPAPVPSRFYLTVLSILTSYSFLAFGPCERKGPFFPGMRWPRSSREGAHGRPMGAAPMRQKAGFARKSPFSLSGFVGRKWAPSVSALFAPADLANKPSYSLCAAAPSNLEAHAPETAAHARDLLRGFPNRPII